MEILEKEHVPEMHDYRDPDAPPAVSAKPRMLLCKVCKDGGAVHVRFPEHMRKYFRREQGFRGQLATDDWLCRSCHANWYRGEWCVIFLPRHDPPR